MDEQGASNAKGAGSSPVRGTIMFKLVLLIIFVEAITELVVKSKIFRPLRKLVYKWFPWFFKQLIECGYCFAFWVSLLSVLLFKEKLIFDNWGGYVLSLFIVHRCASHLHDLMHVVVKHERCKSDAGD